MTNLAEQIQACTNFEQLATLLIDWPEPIVGSWKTYTGDHQALQLGRMIVSHKTDDMRYNQVTRSCGIRKKAMELLGCAPELIDWWCKESTPEERAFSRTRNKLREAIRELGADNVGGDDT